jgi:hypothetical protein
MSFSRLEGMSLRTVELDESDDPIAMGLLGSIGVMMITQHLTNLVLQL